MSYQKGVTVILAVQSSCVHTVISLASLSRVITAAAAVLPLYSPSLSLPLLLLLLPLLPLSRKRARRDLATLAHFDLAARAAASPVDELSTAAAAAEESVTAVPASSVAEDLALLLALPLLTLSVSLPPLGLVAALLVVPLVSRVPCVQSTSRGVVGIGAAAAAVPVFFTAAAFFTAGDASAAAAAARRRCCQARSWLGCA
jgi:hypothetical protein